MLFFTMEIDDYNEEEITELLDKAEDTRSTFRENAERLGEMDLKNIDEKGKTIMEDDDIECELKPSELEILSEKIQNAESLLVSVIEEDLSENKKKKRVDEAVKIMNDIDL